MKRWFILICVGFYVLFGVSIEVTAFEDDLDYEDIQKTMDDILPETVKLSFSDLVDRLIQGDFKSFFEEIGTGIKDQIFFELKNNREIIIQMIGIVLISAVFTNFSMAFSKTFIAETGFYLTYMLLFTLLLTSFMTAVHMASGIVEKMIRFMSALVPVFCLAVTLTGNIQTGIWYQQAMIAGMTLIEWFISKGILKFVYVYVLISMINQLSKEDILSKSAELLKTVALWTTKALLGGFLGIHFIQSLILPAFDTLKNGWASRLTSAVPGVGDAMSSVFKTVIGSAVLIKNGIGMAGLIVLSVIFLVPVCKLILLILMYMAAQAIVQPVADKRMLACIHSVSEGMTLLLKIEGTVFVLFFLSMAIMSAASGTVFGG